MTCTGKEQKRQLLLATALHLFSQNGLDNVSTAQIARQAGVASGSLFFHFRCKSSLIHTLFEHVLRQLQQSLTVPAASCGARDTFTDYFIQIVHFWLTHPIQFGFIRHYYFSPQALPRHKTALETACTGRLIACLSGSPCQGRVPTSHIQAVLFGGIMFLARDTLSSSQPLSEDLHLLAEKYWTGFSQPAPT